MMINRIASTMSTSLTNRGTNIEGGQAMTTFPFLYEHTANFDWMIKVYFFQNEMFKKQLKKEKKR